VRQAREFVGDEPFVVGFGDTIITSPRVPGVVGRMMQSHIQRGAAATIAVWEVPREETYKYGVVTPQGAADDDFAIDNDGATLLVDPLSYQYLMGSEVDYREDLEGARFVINNPNAVTTCGCGASFSI